jgi:hypothetical protein
LLNGCGEGVSVGTTQKGPSSLKSSSKVNNKNHESAFDLKMKGRKDSHGRQQSKSMLESKKKSSVNLSHKNQSSSIIREENSRISGSSKNGRSFLQRVDNQEEHESLSQILMNDVSINQGSHKDNNNIVFDNSCFT